MTFWKKNSALSWDSFGSSLYHSRELPACFRRCWVVPGGPPQKMDTELPCRTTRPGVAQMEGMDGVLEERQLSISEHLDVRNSPLFWAVDQLLGTGDTLLRFESWLYHFLCLGSWSRTFFSVLFVYKMGIMVEPACISNIWHNRSVLHATLSLLCSWTPWAFTDLLPWVLLLCVLLISPTSKLCSDWKTQFSDHSSSCTSPVWLQLVSCPQYSLVCQWIPIYTVGLDIKHVGL
jgi:hypothetical protein